MFGKFGKKKEEKEPKSEVKSETKSKQKNDLFTLLEDSSTNSSVQRQKISKDDSKNTAINQVETKNPISPKKDLLEKPSTTQTKETEQKETKEKETKTNSESSKKFASDSSLERENPKTEKTKEIVVDVPSSVKGDKSQLLVLEVEKLPDKTIRPFVDFNESTLFYPILSKIGESSDNISFLDDLVNEGILKREVFEKLIVCPSHPDTYSSSVRLYCPRCNSLNVDKLNLYEHKRCGYITESTECDFSDPKNATCPSCNKKIVDFKKEIRIPAMWHQCLDCKEKFDNAIIKLYCRKYEHDFETGTGHFFTTYSYRLKDYEAPITSDDDKMKEDLVTLLKDFNFDTEFKANVKGKSGNSHKIPVFSKNRVNDETIAIFINRQSEDLSQAEINSILIPILDVGPKHILLLTTAHLDEFVKPVAKQYGIEIISDPDLSKIIQHVEEFVSERYSRNGEQ